MILELASLFGDFNNFKDFPAGLDGVLQKYLPLDWLSMHQVSEDSGVSINTSPSLPCNWEELYQEIAPLDHFCAASLRLAPGDALVYSELHDPSDEIENYCHEFAKKYTDTADFMTMATKQFFQDVFFDQNMGSLPDPISRYIHHTLAGMRRQSIPVSPLSHKIALSRGALVVYTYKIETYFLMKFVFQHDDGGKTLPLTPMENQVVQLLKQGFIVKEIAHQLNLSERGVNFHKYNIVKNSGALILWRPLPCWAIWGFNPQNRQIVSSQSKIICVCS